MTDYPKTLHKKGGIFSTRFKGVRVSYDVTKAVDEDHENQLLKEGWSDSLGGALKTKKKTKEKPKKKAEPEAEPEAEIDDLESQTKESEG